MNGARLRGAAAGAALLGWPRLVALQTRRALPTLDLVAMAGPVRGRVYRVTVQRLSEAAMPEPVRAVLEQYLGLPE